MYVCVRVCVRACACVCVCVCVGMMMHNNYIISCVFVHAQCKLSCEGMSRGRQRHSIASFPIPVMPPEPHVASFWKATL